MTQPDSPRPPIPPRPVMPLGYADAATLKQLEISSLDRLMTARIARTLGWCIAIAGSLLCLGAFGSGRATAAAIPVATIIAMFVAPGTLLIAGSPGVARGSQWAAVLVLIASIWETLMLVLIAMGQIYLVLIRDGWIFGILWLVIDAMLLIGVGNLLYRNIRVLTVRTLDNQPAEVPGVFETLRRVMFPDGSRRSAVLYGAAGLVISVLLLIAALAAIVRSHSYVAPPPVVRVPEKKAWIADLHSETGLHAVQRQQMINLIDGQQLLTESQSLLLDRLLREHGRQFGRPEEFGRIIFRSGDSKENPAKGEVSSVSFNGGWTIRWQENDFIFVSQHAGQFMLAKGVLWGTERSLQWSWSAIEEMLNDVNHSIGGRMTQPQADKLMESIRKIRYERTSNGFYEAMPPALPLQNARWDDRGYLGLRLNGNETWIAESGDTRRKLPSLLSTPRAAFNLNPMAAWMLAAMSLIGAAAGAWMVIAAVFLKSSEDDIRSLRWPARLHMVAVALSIAAVAWIGISFVQSDPWLLQNKMRWVTFGCAGAGLIWLILSGVILPIRVLRRAGRPVPVPADGA